MQAAHLIISLPIIGLLSGYIIAKSTENILLRRLGCRHFIERSLGALSLASCPLHSCALDPSPSATPPILSGRIHRPQRKACCSHFGQSIRIGETIQ